MGFGAANAASTKSPANSGNKHTADATGPPDLDNPRAASSVGPYHTHAAGLCGLSNVHAVSPHTLAAVAGPLLNAGPSSSPYGPVAVV